MTDSRTDPQESELETTLSCSAMVNHQEISSSISSR
jgi:hypothetical protein